MNTKQAMETLKIIFEPDIKVFKSYPARPPVNFIVIEKTDSENTGGVEIDTFAGLFFSRETDKIDDLENTILEKIDLYNYAWSKSMYIDTIVDTDLQESTKYKIAGKSFNLIIKEIK